MNIKIPKKKIKSILLSPTADGLVSSLISVILGLSIGYLILLVTGAENANEAIAAILTGGIKLVGAPKAVGNMLYYSVPMILCGLSVGFAFKSGVLNIGASGQYIIGALAGVAVSIVGYPLFGNVTWVIAIIAGTLAGGIWGLIPGLLNAYKNVNVIISGIMMNFIGVYLVDLIIKSTPIIYDPKLNSSAIIPIETQLPKWGLDKLFPGANANAGIVIAGIVGIFLYFFINRTTIGYKFRTCGLNRDAAEYTGINVKSVISFSMMISGAIAGMGGALMYMANVGTHILITDEIPIQGFIGISVALLGGLHPLGIMLSGFFISYITVGGFYLQKFGFPSQIIGVILAAIIYSCAFALSIKGGYRKVISRFLTVDNANDSSGGLEKVVENIDARKEGEEL
jgi:simple sugar transport system permease protein